MKIFVSILLIVSTLMVGCDRQTLNGLNLKINAEVNSDYEKDKNSSEETNNTKVSKEVVETEENSSEVKASESKSEEKSITVVSENKEEKEANKVIENDPDKPMAFQEISECSKAGITAKTNEIFYANNSQVKSIDSKNEKQLKAWKKIYNEVEKNCNN